MRPRRRDLLLGGAASGLGALLTGCGGSAGGTAHISGSIVDDEHRAGHRLRDGSGTRPAGTPRERRARVLVVGAGASGLSAAWRLVRAGVEDVTLLELADVPGGTSRGGELAGLAHPWGAHYLPVPRADQTALVRLLDELGLVRGIAPSGRVRVPEEHLVRAPQERISYLGFWQEGLWPSVGASADDEAEVARFEELLAELATPGPDGGRPFDLPVARCAPHRFELDRESAAAWAARHGLTGERVRWYLEYATRDDFGASLADTSAWALAHYFNARLDADGSEADFLTWPEGNARIVRHLADALAGRILCGRLATRVTPDTNGAEVEALELTGGTAELWRADRVVLAAPQFVVRRLLAGDPHADARARFRYSPWVVANLHLAEVPAGRGFPQAWDNVRYDSASLGYVDATHQLDRTARDAVWTWYLPLIDSDEAAARTRLLAATWEDWRDLVLADLRPAHPELARCVTRIDVRRWGHAMVKPTPGLLWSGVRERAAAAVGAVHMAHTDLSGMAIFEEAHWQGVRAAEEALAALGEEFEPWA
ncbi:MAG: FAD-dependent oxidoreductase [Planctomycetota bacterium]